MVIASDTAPVREVLNDKNGLLVPFFDIEQLANSVIEVLTDPSVSLDSSSSTQDHS